MQFFVYDPHWNPEEFTPPTPEFMQKMGEFVEEMKQAGKLVTTGSLPINATRLKLADGDFTVTDGPFVELKELTGGFAVIQADSLEDAIEWSKKFRAIVGDGVSEIVPIIGPM